LRLIQRRGACRENFFLEAEPVFTAPPERTDRPKEIAMSYLIEIREPGGPLGYLVAQAATQDHARALVDAQLQRNDASDEVEIVAVYTIH
jgi:hypothetical protein